MCCMEEGDSGIFGDIPNAPFRDAVLVMCTDAAKGDCLVRRPNIVHKCFIGESSVISMVVEYLYPVLFGETLERVFCVDCFVRCEVLVHVNVREVRHMVHKHRCTSVPSDRWLPFCNGHESRNGGFELVNTDHCSRYGCWFDFWIDFMRSPGLVVSLPVKAAWTFRRRNLRKFSWDDTLLSHLLKLSEGAMAKLLMESHEGSLIGLQEGFVLIIRWDDCWVHREVGSDSLGFRAWWFVCRSVGRRHRDGSLSRRICRFVFLVVGNEGGRHAAKSSECSKLLVAGGRKTNPNVAFVQRDVFVGLFTIFSVPLEGDGISRNGAACVGVSLGLSLLKEHLQNEDVDWGFR